MLNNPLTLSALLSQRIRDTAPEATNPAVIRPSYTRAARRRTNPDCR
jgi:hypothetical protein